MPVGLDCDVLMWVERRQGRLMGAKPVRPVRAYDGLAALYRQIVADGGKAPMQLRVQDEDTAAELSERVGDEVRVGFGFDHVSHDLVQAHAWNARDHVDAVLDLDGGEDVFTLKISLRDVEPAVWRRVRLCGDVSLFALHHVIQEAMGWLNYHLHDFEIGGDHFRTPDADAPEDLVDERIVTANSVLRTGERATYLYDFGDGWTHDVYVESVTPAAAGDPVALVVDGARACPLEDSGGPHGYMHKLAVVANPAAEDDDGSRRELLEWMPPDFEPEAFDVAKANERVRAVFLADENDEDALGDDVDDLVSTSDDVEFPYDGNVAPEPAEWLGMAEDDRLLAIRVHHARVAAKHVPVGNDSLHAAFHNIVENQLAAGKPPGVRAAMARLREQGLSRHEALHAIGSLLLPMLQPVDEGTFDPAQYERDLDKLTAKTWRAPRRR